MIRVLLADDHAMMRDGLRAILGAQDDIDVVGEAEDGVAAVEVAPELRPDVIVMDIRMPRLDGIEATRRLVAKDDNRPARARADDVRPRRVRLRGDTSRRRRLHAQGHAADRLVDAVRTVAAGESLLAPAVTRRLIERYVTTTASDGGAARALRGADASANSRCCGC